MYTMIVFSEHYDSMIGQCVRGQGVYWHIFWQISECDSKQIIWTIPEWILIRNYFVPFLSVNGVLISLKHWSPI